MNNPINTYKLGRIEKAREALKDSLAACSICPRRCGVDRSSGEKGYCRAGLDPVVYSYLSHHGEEPPLSGIKGSGTIFFSHCSMKCVYCQNYYFSQLDNGQEVSNERLCNMMLSLQAMGCHNINLVSPTHFIPQILAALEMAVTGGLNIPIVYNTSGYELADTIRLLDGIVDIYLADMRYSNDGAAMRYSKAPDYVRHNLSALKEMSRQVGNLVLDENGIAGKGIILRLLVMPGDAGGVKVSMEIIRAMLGKDVYLCLMSQYYPAFKADKFGEISRRVTPGEYNIMVDEAARLGLNNGWTQEPPDDASDRFLGTNIRPDIEVF